MEDESMEETAGTNETPRERFKRLAALRVNEVLKRLKILGNCANRRNYEYDVKDIYKIFDEIEKRVQQVKSKFLDAKEQDFKF